MGPTGTSRVVQVHPTRRCNLRCLHCYSSSGPEERGELPVALLRGALDDARALRYDVVALSGGEPLLYSGLEELLAHAHAIGLSTALTTNGMLLTPRRVERLAGLADLVAISVDGPPASHDAMRGQQGAFAAMARRLGDLRAAGIPFGLIFTLTRANLHELEWVFELALAEGARLLQVHPLEETGRASERLPDQEPDGREGAFAALEALRLRAEASGRLAVQLDLLDKPAIERRPGLVYADEPPLAEAGALASAAPLPSPLVVEPDGWVVPLQHGFDRGLGLGDLHAAPLAAHAERWLETRQRAFRALCRRVHAAALRPEAPSHFDWYGLVSRASREARAALQGS